jgi:acetate kinase
MRALLDSPAPEAAEAVDLFCYRIARELGSLAAALGGLDALVFTAGIGEHAAPVREQVCRQAEWLGVQLDAEANARHAARISTNGSQVDVLVLPTNEEWMIARHAAALVS